MVRTVVHLPHAESMFRVYAHWIVLLQRPQRESLQSHQKSISSVAINPEPRTLLPLILWYLFRGTCCLLSPTHIKRGALFLRTSGRKGMSITWDGLARSGYFSVLGLVLLARPPPLLICSCPEPRPIVTRRSQRANPDARPLRSVVPALHTGRSDYGYYT